MDKKFISLRCKTYEIYQTDIKILKILKCTFKDIDFNANNLKILNLKIIASFGKLLESIGVSLNGRPINLRKKNEVETTGILFYFDELILFIKLKETLVLLKCITSFLLVRP